MGDIFPCRESEEWKNKKPPCWVVFLVTRLCGSSTSADPYNLSQEALGLVVGAAICHPQSARGEKAPIFAWGSTRGRVWPLVLNKNPQEKSPPDRVSFFRGGDCWTRTSDLLRVKHFWRAASEGKTAKPLCTKCLEALDYPCNSVLLSSAPLIFDNSMISHRQPKVKIISSFMQLLFKEVRRLRQQRNLFQTSLSPAAILVVFVSFVRRRKVALFCFAKNY